MCAEKTSRVRFYLFLVGVVLTLSGAYGVVPLVSSLNVEEAIGKLIAKQFTNVILYMTYSNMVSCFNNGSHHRAQ